MNLRQLLTIDSPIPLAADVIFNVEHLLFGNSRKIHVKLIESNEKFVRIRTTQENPFTCVGLSRNRVVTGTAQGNLQFHKISDLDLKTTRKAHHGQVNTLAIREDIVMTGGYDKTVKLWSLKGKDKPLHVFSGHKNWVSSVAFGQAEDSLEHPNRVVSGSLDKTVKLWDVQTGKHWQSIALDSQVHTVTYDPQRKIVCASTNQYLLIIDPFNDQISQCYPIPEPASHIMHFKNFIMTAHKGAALQAFDIVKGQKVAIKGILGSGYCQCKDYMAVLADGQCGIYQMTQSLF